MSTVAPAADKATRLTAVPRVAGTASWAGWTPDRVKELRKNRRQPPNPPPGRMHAPNPVAWLRQVENDPRVQGMRADRRRNVYAVARILARCWHPVTQMSTPGHDVIAAELGCDRKTVTRLMMVLRETGWVIRGGAGWTAQAMGVQLRAEYWLTVPLPHEEPLPERGSRREPLWPATRSPRTKRDRLMAAQELLSTTFRAARTARGATAAAVASALRPFFAAGWTLGDVRHAVDTRPDGRAWTFEQGVRHLAGWLRSRLSAWLDAAGGILPSRSQRARAAARRAREDAARREAERARDAAESVPSDALPERVPAYVEARRRLRQQRSESARRGLVVSGENVAPYVPSGNVEKNTPHGRARTREGGVRSEAGGRRSRFGDVLDRIREANQQRQDRRAGGLAELEAARRAASAKGTPSRSDRPLTP